jgi:membrane protein
MNKLEQPLYPKLSSIYNKILQLVSAILLIVILMFFLVTNTEQNDRTVEQHFEQIADKFLQQAISGISVILTDYSTPISKKERNVQLQSYLNNLAAANYIKHAHLYDHTGLLMLKSESDGESTNTIKLIYGIDEVMPSLDRSKQYIPVIQEIRNVELTGYLRLTIEKSYLTSELSKNNYETHATFRLLLIAAGVIGFLLTRGLNRFSRQGYRAPKTN